MDLRDLSKPFASEDIEWRVQRSGVKNDGKVWAMVTAYVTNRAIMDRLDEVCGPQNWQNRFEEWPNGSQLCCIEINVERSGDDGSYRQWVSKWDGAGNTAIEAVKGGLSSAMKRAAVQWGIGRYLYKVEEGFAQIFDEQSTPVFNGKGIYKGEAKKKDGTRVFFTWNPPKLPDWALPKGDEGTGASPVQEEGASEGEDKHITKEKWAEIQKDLAVPGLDPKDLIAYLGVKKAGDIMESDLAKIKAWITSETDRQNAGQK